MQTINIQEAQNHLFRLTEAAAAGEVFIIAKAGRPMVRVVPHTERQKKQRRIGFMPEIAIPDNFNDWPDGGISEAFSGDGQ
ncbi:type II toxin-antitoxin system Phd/YefM family antitoxin [Neisseria lisongii]|uniref:Antitoxin n=1 Tax=Neisseria lisongii TaxID=2912188 RepID=A0AAW5AT51_9NEIS|nr:type II toxin-antitoxin system prevent-host-death family antitoxin [Neisseria lisongii]MCF7530558.1 type II toxin-antitoxin system prevent-host-death family antitoxin [Neisseria lisongii]